MSDGVEELSDLHSAKRAWQNLLDSPEWGILTGTLQKQADSIQREIIYNPLGALDEALRQEYRKGQLVGLLQITAIVETEMEILDREIERLQGSVDHGTGNAE